MVMQSSHSCGLRSCGIAELPTVPGGAGSAASASSVFIGWQTTIGTRPSRAATPSCTRGADLAE
jgi:hypothetical protein